MITIFQDLIFALFVFYCSPSFPRVFYRGKVGYEKYVDKIQKKSYIQQQQEEKHIPNEVYKYLQNIYNVYWRNTSQGYFFFENAYTLGNT